MEVQAERVGDLVAEILPTVFPATLLNRPSARGPIARA